MRNDLVCDGLYGHAHLRTVLAHMIEEAEGPVDLMVSLRQPPPDDYSDETEAFALLSTEKRTLGLDGGDLCWCYHA